VNHPRIVELVNRSVLIWTGKKAIDLEAPLKRSASAPWRKILTKPGPSNKTTRDVVVRISDYVCLYQYRGSDGGLP
jgi:hypothetical protein